MNTIIKIIGVILIASVVVLFFPLNLFDEKLSLVVIAPMITANAYTLGGYYQYFLDECDEKCLTVEIDNDIRFGYTSSSNALIKFQKAGVEIIDDYALSFNPDYINEFDHVVLLHNEYVTQEIFDVVTNHPSVFYMYPNALYGKVIIVDEKATLIKGHSIGGVDNGFDWQFDNTRPDEFDIECTDHYWRVVSNGYQLSCYPENRILFDDSIMDFIFNEVKSDV